MHDPNEYPLIDQQGFVVQPGTQIFASVLKYVVCCHQYN